MSSTIYSLKTCCYAFLIWCLLICWSVFAQSDDLLDLDDFDSEDDFVWYLLEILGEGDDWATIVSSSVWYAVASTTSSSATITYTSETGEDEAETFYVQVYTDAWDGIDASDDAFEWFIVEREISPTYNNWIATLYINKLLPWRTYYMVVWSEKNNWVEIVVPTKDVSKSIDSWTIFLTDVLFDWDEYSSYMWWWLYNAYFLWMLSEALHGMSKNRQWVVIRGMYKNIKAIPQTAFLALWLDYHWFVWLLKDASTETNPNTGEVEEEVVRKKVVWWSVKRFVTDNENLNISWQVFPSKETGKKWVTFRTNFMEEWIIRSTRHMDMWEIHTCQRTQCTRFWYLLEDNMNHIIDVNLVRSVDGEYEWSDEILKVSL